MTKRHHKGVEKTPSLPDIEYKELSLDVLHFDENQPRKTFGNIPGLAASIESQGLQQAIVVNRWKVIDGVMHYIVDKGERRTTAHHYLVKQKGLPKFKTIKALIQKEWYDGKRDTARKLAQYAENDQREPHTKKETVLLLRELVEEERAMRRAANESEHGAVQIGVGKLCEAVGRPKSWGDRYWTLSGLIPELLDLLDLENEEERLGNSAALRLAPAPAEMQMQIYLASEAHFKKGGHMARAAYIHQQVRTIRQELGEKIRGRPIDEKKKILNCARQLTRLTEKLAGGRNNKEHLANMETVLGAMDAFEIDQVLGNLRAGGL
jgi:hypothetical protein